MATRTWVGDDDNDLGNLNNWSGDTLPADTESFGWIKDGDSGTNPTTGMADLAAYNSDQVFVEEGYTKNIGANGNQLDLNSWNQFLHRGSGKVWLLAGGGTCDLVTVMSTAASPLTEVMDLDGTTTTTLSILRGLVTVSATGVVNNIVLGSEDFPASGANVAVTNGADVDMVHVHDGAGTCNADIDEDLIMYGGTWTQLSNTIAGQAMIYGGTFNFQYAGTIPLVIQFGGLIDCTKGAGQKTFTRYIRLGGQCRGLDSGILSVGTYVDLRG